MDTRADILHSTDWSRTFHAHGPATDAPEILAGLLSEKEEEWSKALGYLNGAILRRGTVYPATPPAALFVASLLADRVGDLPVSEPWGEAAGAPSDPLRPRLLGFLADVARAVTEASAGRSVAELVELADPGERRDELDALLSRRADRDAEGDGDPWEDPLLDTLFHAALRDLHLAAPALLGAVRPLLTHADGRVRQQAVTASGALSRLGDAPEVDLSGAADLAENRDQGAAIVLALVEGGGDTSAFLTHPDQAIRACAALSEHLGDDPVALGELRAALADPSGADAWFQDRPGFFPGRVRFSLVAALVDRSGPEDAADLLPAFRALAAVASVFTSESDLSGLLRLAMGVREGTTVPEVVDPTDLQRAYLTAVVDNDRLWATHVADLTLVLHGLGLPSDRGALAALAAHP
ncbi:MULTISPECIES: hypothetical protein [unclassified Nocardiopsis]|uniref:hypothetical protein n=1 Tax=unclassified Nocardiopsis TaxID=2649073 RepID=UPI00066BFEA7|nr:MULTISPECIES: hypothetical protein [unclassified Nocardiopsis]MBQ1080874.1 hypothetical protein [Nocardiopsis sp. B62]